MGNRQPRLSLITVCYNSSSTIKDTMESVQAQDFEDFEHIIIDGGSQDGTLDIVRSFSSPNLKIVSGKDKGIYDAMNKGLELMSGDVVGFLNSDDFFATDHVFSVVAKSFDDSNLKVVYGDLDVINPSKLSRITRRWKAGSFAPAKMRRGWHPPHPGFFIRKDFLDKVGFFNINYKISADYDLMLRCLSRLELNEVKYHPEVFVKMRAFGHSNSGIIQLLKANLECMQSAKNMGIGTFYLIPVLKPLWKLPQLWQR